MNKKIEKENLDMGFRLFIFLIVFTLGGLAVSLIIISIEEYHDLPNTNLGEWENIGQELCELKFYAEFVDWEDGELICLRPDVKSFNVKEWNGTDFIDKDEYFYIEWGNKRVTWVSNNG